MSALRRKSLLACAIAAFAAAAAMALAPAALAAEEANPDYKLQLETVRELSAANLAAQAELARARAKIAEAVRDIAAPAQSDQVRLGALQLLAQMNAQAGGLAAPAMPAQAWGAGMPMVPGLPPPRESWDDKLLKWTAVILPAVTHGYTAYTQKALGIVQSNNSAQVAIAGTNAMATMGAQIRDAGIAGYPYVQAPQPVQTIHGNGVIGGGTFTWDQRRHCVGGAVSPLPGIAPAGPGALTPVTGTAGNATC
ncbi:MAG: hypothetical protein KJ007_02870 [Burkholderiales bacterium]|nr:hypothetical protein [Burkholderiales bacterium]